MRRAFLSAAAAAGVASQAAPRKAPSFESKVRGAMMGALVVDALSLCTHYEYDAVKIKKFYGSIDKYMAPGEKTGGQTHGVGWGARNFHNGNGNGPGKKAGENTDYGDYNLLILEHLAKQDTVHKIDLNKLIPDWQEGMKTWRSWMCTQTRQALQQVAQGAPYSKLGGHSNAMSLRHAGVYGYFDNEKDVAHAAKAVMFTHKEMTALAGGEFFAKVTFRIIHKGLTGMQAIKEVADESQNDFITTKVKQGLDKCKEATDPSSPLSKEEFVDDLALTSMARLWDVGKSEPIKVGKASPTEGVLPGSIYFICKYEGDLVAAAKANAMVGGDSASRAVVIGSVMGASVGLEGIPDALGKGSLVEWDKAMALLDKMPLLQGGRNEL